MRNWLRAFYDLEPRTYLGLLNVGMGAVSIGRHPWLVGVCFDAKRVYWFTRRGLGWWPPCR